MKQILITARLVFQQAWRGNLLPGMLLVMLPLFYAAWAFETANPGFQTGFIADVSGSAMTIIAGLLVVVLGYEHFYWPASQHTPWFYFSRIGKRSYFAAGRFLGVLAVVFAALLIAAAVFMVMLRLSEGFWFVSLLTTALLVFYEAALMGAIFQLLAAFSSKLLATGGLLVIFVSGHNLPGLRASLDFAGVAGDILLAVLPDLAMFRGAWFSGGDFAVLVSVSLYAILQALFYLAATGLILQRRDL
ncbi:MAG TPA: hypothetical protein PLM07_00530 [Candidatus Rifleibacterium sp.]|nr:hypothetical protein [Candidatus Rifleibacterium sp.]HPT44365.1 hypothetical protein [Candidatus Rifleibacterium sp.]